MTDTKTLAYHRYVNGRLMGLRTNRYSWWVHWKELADYFLPRRYKWLITPNQMSRGSPINQYILDSTGCTYARNLASGLVSGKSSPTSLWFRLRIGYIDSTETSPASLWLAEVERIMYLIFSESNFTTPSPPSITTSSSSAPPQSSSTKISTTSSTVSIPASANITSISITNTARQSSTANSL